MNTLKNSILPLSLPCSVPNKMKTSLLGCLALPNNVPINNTAQKFWSIIYDLIHVAKESTLNHQLAACIMKKYKKITPGRCNSHGLGSDNPSRHAEYRALIELHGGKNIKYTASGWKIPDDIIRKNRNRSILVVRAGTFNNMTVLVNARPCMKCLEMLKSCGLKEVHYSDDTGNIKTEKIKDMISVHASHVTIKYDYMAKNKEVANDNAYLNKVISKQLYYDNLIKNGIPDYVRALNFTYFTDYNLTKLSATYYVEKTQKKATIFNGMNQMIKTINIT